MIWTPLHVIATAAGCALVVMPIICFFASGMIGVYFGRKEKLLREMNSTVDDILNKKGSGSNGVSEDLHRGDPEK